MQAETLTVNAGSSSIKVASFAGVDGHGELQAAAWSGTADGLGAGLAARLRIRDSQGAVLHDVPLAGSAATHAGALDALLDWRGRQPAAGRIAGVGHRIVHGGADFVAPVRIDTKVLQALAALEPLAPLHQPQNLAGVRAAITAFPGVPQVACFDTAFHAVQPEVNRRFAIPRALHDGGVRRYGFHGLSYESIVAQVARLDPSPAKIVVAHLGNGASMCAIDRGRSIATTMSFSPLDGLTMGTRCGHIDAAAVLYLLQSRGMTAERVSTLLYRESGLLGISGVSSDMRELEASTTPAAAEAIDHFVEQVLQNLGAMVAALRGVDAVVFTGGIGENAEKVRSRVLAAAAWLGLRADPSRSEGPLLTEPGSAVAAWVLRTDEEAVIARHVARVSGAG